MQLNLFWPIQLQWLKIRLDMRCWQLASFRPDEKAVGMLPNLFPDAEAHVWAKIQSCNGIGGDNCHSLASSAAG